GKEPLHARGVHAALLHELRRRCVLGHRGAGRRLLEVNEDVRKRAVRMSADPKCEEINDGERVISQDQVIGADGELANVFVYLKEAPAGTTVPKDAAPAQLVQQGCMYAPRVQGLFPEQQLEVVNDDPTLHNVRCLARSNRPFNLGQPAKGKRTKFFTTPEKAIKFKCDVHPWMSAYIFVMDHPYFGVSDADGKFSIDGLPAGKHTFVAWHEKFGEQEIEIEVGSDAPTEIVFSP
ncbi:MAG: hypothetical protein AAGA81_14615, partial [Acidobacteriota bacterium]